MGASHWSDLASRWAALGPPLRPPPPAVDAVLAEIAGHTERVLLLGVTPELADAGDEVVAVERNPDMVGAVWPGDTEHRSAVLGDWRALGVLGPGSFTAAIGDGALTCVGHDELPGLLADLVARLRPGGSWPRCFVRPDVAEPLDAVRVDVLAGRVGSIHACKWRVAMAVAGERDHPEVAVEDVLAAFDATFPDRGAVAAATGWSSAAISSVDAYRGSAEVYSFATAEELLAAVPGAIAGVELVPTAGYELAERCPVLVLRP